MGLLNLLGSLVVWWSSSLLLFRWTVVMRLAVRVALVMCATDLRTDMRLWWRWVTLMVLPVVKVS